MRLARCGRGRRGREIIVMSEQSIVRRILGTRLRCRMLIGWSGGSRRLLWPESAQLRPFGTASSRR